MFWNSRGNGILKLAVGFGLGEIYHVQLRCNAQLLTITPASSLESKINSVSKLYHS